MSPQRKAAVLLFVRYSGSVALSMFIWSEFKLSDSPPTELAAFCVHRTEVRVVKFQLSPLKLMRKINWGQKVARNSMVLSKIVVNLYTVLLEIGLWLFLVVGLIGGWQAGGFFGAIGGLIGAAIFGAVFFGAFLVINDIRSKVKAIEERQKS